MSDSIVTPYYNNYLNEISKKSMETRGYSKFHPSAFGGCERKMALQFYGEKYESLKIKDPVEPKLQRTFEAGHSFHDRMQRHFAIMGILKGHWKSKISGKIYGREKSNGIFMPKTMEEVGEKKLDGDSREVSDLFEYVEVNVNSDEYNFTGHVDGIIEVIDEEDYPEEFVIDFKTANDDQFKMIKEKPHAKYIVQIHIYMWLLGIKKGIIFYENKNRHDIKEFYIPYNDLLVEDIKAKAKKLKTLLERGQLPTIPSHYTTDRAPCSYCEYKDPCYKKSRK